MTRQESFKRRIRARMGTTGEKYTAARRSLIQQAGGRAWAAQPELADESVNEATGRGWDEWCDLIDAWPGHADGHSQVAAWLREVHGVDGWWAQTVTVGWERITGRRLPHQRPDGTFNVSKSRTMTIDVNELRSLLIEDRDDLFPGFSTELRSKPTSKSLLVGMDDGTALFSFDALPDGRTRVTVSHEKLDQPDHVEEWRGYWDAWLAAIDEG
jgi:hypothetical protein